MPGNIQILSSLKIVGQEPTFATEEQTAAYAELKEAADILDAHFDARSIARPGAEIQKIRTAIIAVDALRRAMIRGEALQTLRPLVRAAAHRAILHQGLLPLEGEVGARYSQRHFGAQPPAPVDVLSALDRHFSYFESRYAAAEARAGQHW